MRVFAAILLVACGGGAPAAPAHPSTPRDAAVATAEVGPSAAECEALLDHAITLAASDTAQVTDDDKAHTRAALHDRIVTGCRALPRTTYACAFAAPTTAALVACD